jgi:hypothetical protein
MRLWEVGLMPKAYGGYFDERSLATLGMTTTSHQHPKASGCVRP